MVICLEAQAVTAADLGQEHGILAWLDFSPILNQVDLLSDQCSSLHVMDRSVYTTQSACQWDRSVEMVCLLSWQLP